MADTLTPRERAERLLQLLDAQHDPAERLFLATTALELQASDTLEQIRPELDAVDQVLADLPERANEDDELVDRRLSRAARVRALIQEADGNARLSVRAHSRVRELEARLRRRGGHR